MRDITLSDLNKIAGRSRSSMRGKIVKAINKYKAQYDCDTPERMALFLAHTCIESAHFKQMEEGLSYSAKRLRQVWPRRFKTDAIARKYARNPKALANYVYGGRMGNKGKKDAGWLYRGSGLGQTTGYDNFKEFEDATGLPVTKNPDMLRDPDQGTKAAFVFWQRRNMNRFAAMGGKGVKPSRKVWNGGYNHLKEVTAAYRKAIRVLAGGAKRPSPTPLNPHINMLKEGDRGSKVKRLQESLMTLECMQGHADGVYGPKTVQGVRTFQNEHKLLVDGIAGNDTLTAIAAALTAKAEAEKKAKLDAKADVLREQSKGAKAKEVVEDAAATGRVSKEKAGSIIVGTGAAIDAASEVKEQMDKGKSLLEGFTEMLASPTFLIMLLIVAVAVFLWMRRNGRLKRALAVLKGG